MNDTIQLKPQAPVKPEKKIIKTRLSKDPKAPLTGEPEEGKKRRARKRSPVKEVSREAVVDGIKVMVPLFEVALGKDVVRLGTKKAATKAYRDYLATHKPKKSKHVKAAKMFFKKWDGLPDEKDFPPELVTSEEEITQELRQYLDKASEHGYTR